ncbi:hypothetical protein PRZ48_012217 [Zasmidium cellare]|uniref:Uncharacterized protein n=1 Tax=Zasmidium cellare TaxID=395010 RepID=A0ABR0E4B8_ZASCE|nr:hypothetical protein PRZ48_012217 [Zasmidium cellare]
MSLGQILMECLTNHEDTHLRSPPKPMIQSTGQSMHMQPTSTTHSAQEKKSSIKQTKETPITTILETRTKAFVDAINARDFAPPTSNSDNDPSPWKFLHSSFRADLSGLLSRPSVDVNQEAPPAPSRDSVVDRREIVNLFASTAAKFPKYRMTVSNASTSLDGEEGCASVFVNVDVLGLETGVEEGRAAVREDDGTAVLGDGKVRGLVRRSVGEFE